MTEIEARKGLNDRQRKFAELVFKGSAASQAYQKAGYVSTGNNAEACASKLLRNAKVERYLNYLRSKTTKSTIKTKKQVEEALSRLMDQAEAENNFAGFKGLAERLAKMQGHDEPERHDVTKDININIGGYVD